MTTNKSIINNLIDPTIYAQGGDSVVKGSFENIPEDWIMYVQLFVVPHYRSFLISKDKTITATGNEGILIADIPYYGKIVDKSTSGKVIPFDIQTTEYTDMFGATSIPVTKDKVFATLGQESAFGITNISIAFEDTTKPTVEIQFIDARGVGLSSYAYTGDVTKSPYSWFFSLPFPEFCLKVKGFYGKTISIPLVMTKFDMKYNNSTGNFDITCKFVGYPYSILNDINIKILERLCCIPGGQEALKDAYTNLVSCLDENNMDDYIRLRDLPNPEDLCIKDYLRAFEEKKAENPIHKFFTTAITTPKEFVSKYNAIMTSGEDLLIEVTKENASSDTTLYDKFIDYLVSAVQLETAFQEVFELSTGSVTTDKKYNGLGGKGTDPKLYLKVETTDETILTIKDFADFMYEKSVDSSNFNRITTTEKSSTVSTYQLSSSIAPESTIKTSVDKILSTQTNPTAAILEAILSNTTFTGGLTPITGTEINSIEKVITLLSYQFETRKKYISGYMLYLYNWFSLKEPDLVRKYPAPEKTRPSLQQIITVIALNVEAFLRLLIKVSREAETYHQDHINDKSYKENLGTLDANNKTTEDFTSSKDIHLYPWPKVYVKNTTDDVKTEVFPPTLNQEFLNWPEVDFTRDVIDALADNNCEKSVTKLAISSGGSNISWSSMNIFEDAPFTFGKSINTAVVPVDSPYNNTIFNNYISTTSDQPLTEGQRETTLKQLITSRALISLYYFNRFFDSSITNDEYIGYIKNLATRDAKTVVTTLDQCNLIELISDKLNATIGSSTLATYITSDAFKTFKESKLLKYTDETTSESISMPYGLTFYLGNNDIKTFVSQSDITKPQYKLPRSADVTAKDIFDTNFAALTYLDKAQYPFKNYITVELNNGTIITGFDYVDSYKNKYLSVPVTKNVIYNYCPFTSSGVNIALPLNIKISNISNPNICRNEYYDTINVKNIIKYETFLNPSHIRDVETFNFDVSTNLPFEVTKTITPNSAEKSIISYGNGVPDVSVLFNKLTPVLKTISSNDKDIDYVDQLGIKSFLSYKPVSDTEVLSDADCHNHFQIINIYDNKTYYWGVDPLLTNMSNTIRTYHTTFNHYSSDILKSFLWDPTKTKIGNPTNPIGVQDGSVYNVVTNLSDKKLSTLAYMDKSGGLTTLEQTSDLLFRETYKAGSWWAGKYDNTNESRIGDTGFQNTIFYSVSTDVDHQFHKDYLLDQYTGVIKLPLLYRKSETINDLSLIRYLFTNKDEYKATTTIPNSSYWINDFGGDSSVGVDYNGSTFSLKDMFYGESPLLDTKKYFTKYTDLIKNNGLDDSIMYEIPVDMNSTWFRSKTYTYGLDITPVKKYQTTSMKKMCYLIWKEASMRVLKMCEIQPNIPTYTTNISKLTWGINNLGKYGSVKLLDIPNIRPGGPSSGLTDYVYPQSKFYNKNIDIYNNDNNYKFYDIKYKGNDSFGYKILPGQTFVTAYPSQNSTIPVIPYPNDDPTNNYGVLGAQPPLLTKPLSDYSGITTDITYWTKLYIHQTKWWEDMTTNINLNSDEINMMKTYLVLMSLWGANAMDSLVYNYPFINPSNGLFRVNNIDLLTVGAFLWAAEGKLMNGVDVKTVVQSSTNFPIDTPTATVYKFGDPSKTFPFNVFFKSNKYDYVVNNVSFDRFQSYGINCYAANNIDAQIGYRYGETDYTTYSDGSAKQTWKMEWSMVNPSVTVEVTPFNLADDLRRDLINNFNRFCSVSEFSRNIDNNLESLSVLREITELALNQVEDAILNGESRDIAYHRFPFDIEQTLLMWSDWASIVDLCQTTKEFKSYYDVDDGYMVKRPEQRVILSSKLFDMISWSKDDTDTVFDNPFKHILNQVISGDTYYYSPMIRMKYGGGYQNDLLALKGDVGKKILLKLMKVISYDEQQTSQTDIIVKRKNKYETELNYKVDQDFNTTPGNDQNFFFESLFKGFYCMNLSGGMTTTKRSNYDFDSLGGYKLFFSKSWMDCQADNWKKTSDEIFNSLQGSKALTTYFDSFITNITNIKDGVNYKACSSTDDTKVVKTHTVELSNDSLLFYRSFQNLVNRWVAGSTGDDYQFKKSGCASIIGDDSQNCKSLVQQIYIVDRVNRPSGDMIYIDPETFKDKWDENPTMSIMSFLSEILADQGYFYFEYPIFFNFGSYGLNMDVNPGQSLWGMTTRTDEKYAGPAIVIYTQKVDNAKAQSEINDYVNEDVSSYPEDFMTEDSRGVLFKVAPAHENNNIFTSVQVDTTEFKETWEHIQILANIAEDHDNAKTKFMNQSLYNLWSVRSWTVTVECFGNMMIQTGMYFWLENMPIFGGLYIIKKVKHAIEPHMIKTTFWGTRVPRVAQPYAIDNPVGFYFTCAEEPDTEDDNELNDEPASLVGTDISTEATLSLVTLFKDVKSTIVPKQPTTGSVGDGTGWRTWIKSIHHGVDIHDATIQDIYAFYAGTVYAVSKGNWANWTAGATAGWPGTDRRSQNGGYGNTVIIKHDITDSSGTQYIFYTQYSHLETDSITVAAGDTVTSGQKIGQMGSTGTSTGRHLHFQVTYDGKYVMAETLIGGGTKPSVGQSVTGGDDIDFS